MGSSLFSTEFFKKRGYLFGKPRSFRNEAQISANRRSCLKKGKSTFLGKSTFRIDMNSTYYAK